MSVDKLLIKTIVTLDFLICKSIQSLKLITLIIIFCWNYNSIFILSEEVVDGKKDLVQPNEKHYDGIPQFLKQPHPVYYVNSSAPALIICEAQPVSHVNIFCAEKEYSYMNQPTSESGLKVEKFNALGLPDPTNGKRWLFSLEIKLKDVLEWFSEYKCYCEAWNQILAINKVKKVHSSVALIMESYLQGTFKKPPQSQKVALDQRLELNCVPPDARPLATVTWLKNGKEINSKTNPRVIIENGKYANLVIDRVRNSDGGNYTCVARSLSNLKYSVPAMIVITNKYFWSEWTEWKPCPVICHDADKCLTIECRQAQRKKIRFCIYRNSKTDVINCLGEDTLVESCDNLCQAGQSLLPPNPSDSVLQPRPPVIHPPIESINKDQLYSDWSISCHPQCIQTRFPICLNGPCYGIPIQARNCSENLCKIAITNTNDNPNVDDKSTMYIGLFTTIGILFIIIVIIVLSLFTRNGYRLNFLPRRSINFSAHSNGVKKLYSSKMISSNNEKLLLSNNDTNSPAISFPTNPITIKNHNALQHNSHLTTPIVTITNNNHGSQEHKYRLLDSNNNSSSNHHIHNNNTISNHSNYSPVYEMHSHALLTHCRDQIAPAIYSEYPLVVNSSSSLGNNSNSLQRTSNITNNNLTTTMTTSNNNSNSPFHRGLAQNSNPMSISDVQYPSAMSYNLTPQHKHPFNIYNPNIERCETVSRPVSALYQELSIGHNSCSIVTNYLPPDTDLATVAWATFTNTNGGRLYLPQSGISLTIPRNAFLHNNPEEIFLAVCRDQTRFPVLEANEILLSPVVMTGPIMVQLNKSIIVSVPHCATITSIGNSAHTNTRSHASSPSSQSNNCIRLLAARYQNHQLPPLWKELAIIHPLCKSDGQTYVQMDEQLAHILLDSELPQMFCLTGRINFINSSNNNSGLPQQPINTSLAINNICTGALDENPDNKITVMGQNLSDQYYPLCSIRLRVLVFCDLAPIQYSSNHISDTQNHASSSVVLRIHVVLDTREAMENVIDLKLRNHCILLDSNHKLQMSTKQGDLGLNVITDPSCSWQCRSGSKIQNFSMAAIWKLNHVNSVDTTVVIFESHSDKVNPSSVVKCRINLYQMDLSSLTSTGSFSTSSSTSIDIVQDFPINSLINPSNETVGQPFHSWDMELDGRQQNYNTNNFLDPVQNIFRLSSITRQNLWPLLDPLWKTLAHQFGLNGNLKYFAEKSRPSDTILDLWEARERHETALLDLINVMLLLGRNDCAMILEQDLLNK